MIKDINPGSGSSYTPNAFTMSFAAIGPTVFFPASDGTNGVELWKTDGTESGTSMVKDIHSGSGSSSPFSLFSWASNDEVYFFATDGINGDELWKTDGTEEGTSMVKNIYSGATDGAVDQCKYTDVDCMAIAGSSLFFVANDDGNYELFKTDGTESGTVSLTPNIGNLPTDRSIVAIGSYVYFIVYDGSSTGIARSDGSTTSMATSYQAGQLATDGTVLYFAGNDGSSGLELAVYDPSDGSVSLLTDHDGQESFLVEEGCSGSMCGQMEILGDSVLIQGAITDAEGNDYSGSAFYSYDTSTSSLTMLTETAVNTYDDIRDINVIGPKAYFTAETFDASGQIRRSLWVTDGTTSGTSQISEMCCNSFSTTDHHQGIYEVGDSILTWAWIENYGRELVHNQSVITTISYSY